MTGQGSKDVAQNRNADGMVFFDGALRKHMERDAGKPDR